MLHFWAASPTRVCIIQSVGLWRILRRRVQAVDHLKVVCFTVLWYDVSQWSRFSLSRLLFG
jgi:hypothetical protein